MVSLDELTLNHGKTIDSLPRSFLDQSCKRWKHLLPLISIICRPPYTPMLVMCFLKAVCRLISLAETDAPGQSLWVLQIDIQEEWKGKEPRKIQVYTNEPSRDGKPLL